MERNNPVNRRRVLKSITSAGLAATISQPVLGRTPSDDDDKVEYVKYLLGEPPNREKVFGEVSREHWAVRFTADDVKDQMLRRIEKKWGRDSLLTAKWGPMSESPTGFGVEVIYKRRHTDDSVTTPEPSLEEVKNKIPDRGRGTSEQDGHAFERSNIPIKVVKRTERPVGCPGEGNGCQDTSSGNYTGNIPGGIPVEDGQKGTYGYDSTLCAGFDDNSYGEGWIGSGHSMDVGHDIHHPTEYDIKIGTCRKKNNDPLNDIEWSYIEADSSLGRSASSDIANAQADGGIRYSIAGIVTDNGLKNDVGTGTIYTTHSRNVCAMTGTLKGTGGWTSWVSYTHDIEEGDSGGPLFKAFSHDSALIAAKHTSEIKPDDDGDDCLDDGKGTTAETVENKVGGHFLTS